MSKFTFVCNAGRRVVVQPSKTKPGDLQLELLGADRQSLGLLSFDAANAGALIAGIEAAVLGARPWDNAAGKMYCTCNICLEEEWGGRRRTHAECELANFEADI